MSASTSPSSLLKPPPFDSPPTTPPTSAVSSSAPTVRQASLSPSDDSSIFELSFEYQVDSAGNIVRISKGSSRESNHSSPPTPQELLHDRDVSPPPIYSSSDAKPSSPVLLSALDRRGSLSRSESAHAILPSTTPAAAPTRSFQRTVSGPAAITPGPSAVRAPLSTDRGTGRKIGRPQRVAMDDYKDMEEKNRIYEDDARARGELGILEEKENIHSEIAESKRRSPPPSVLPPTTAASHIPSSLPTRHGRTLTDMVPVQQRLGRVILPGPNRAGRVLKGSKYSAVTGFDKITEVESSENEHATDNGGEDTDPAEDLLPPPTSAPANGTARQRTYGLSSASGGLALSHSGNTRPRRSASLSDTATQQERKSPQPQSAVVHAVRPGSSLGLNSAAYGGRARRVTLEEKMKQEKEAALELEEYERKQAERREAEEAEAERRSQAVAHAEARPQSRQSPSPTHISTHLRPGYHHQRRDSDTLRSLAPGLQIASSTPPDVIPSRLSPSARNFSTSSSTSAAAARHRRSPTAPEPGTTSGTISNGVNSVATGKTWAAGDERGRPREIEERGALMKSVPHHHVPQRQQQQQQQQQPPAPLQIQPQQQRSAPPAPQTVAASASAPDVRSKNLFVNKKAYVRLDMIGKGGSSRVYRVMNQASEIFAIKRVSLDKTDADTMCGYMNEIALLKRLEGNSRIIRLVDSEVKAGPGGSKGHLMLVMECGEIDLARLLQDQQKEPMNMIWVSYYWQQMLQAVQVIHEEKIVHSDLKPANFVLVRGQLKLIDFGIANAIANDTTNIQRDHQIGTVNYMSPEAIELPDGMRRLKVGRASDVWSLGCILYQMVYGHPPFQHLNVYQKMKAIPDLAHVIDFPEFSTPSMPRTQGSESPPKMLDYLKRRVRRDVIANMKGCLCRNPKERNTIPELLDEDWLAMKEPEPPAAKDLLAKDETIINPYYMCQLLQYGIKLGQTQNTEMDISDLRREAERLVAELKALEQ